MTSVNDPMVGHALDGRYEILERLARGGMATVYKALDTRLGRVVAVKIMHEGLGDDTDFTRKFDREARAAARLSHPNVVSVFDQGHDLGRPYIVMEYVEGTTLRAVIVRDAPLTPLRALDLLDPVLSALASAHEAGLVHRDIKPENVLISTRGSLKVADFGLAKALSAQTATATQGMLIGTVSYVPPELVMEGRADCRSDVYSTGVVLYEMLTGRKPHTGDSPIQVAYAHVHNDVPPPSERMSTSWRHSRDAIPPYLDALVQCATARDPEQRPRDARVLQEHVRRARAALLDGVMDDPDLTRELSRPTSDDDESTAVVLPSGGLSEQTNPTVRQARPRAAAARVEHPRPQDYPRTPVSPQDFEHTIPPVAFDDGEPTPVGWERDVADQHGPARRPRRWIVALLLALVMVVGGAGWWFADGRWTAAPAVAAMTSGQAQQALNEAHLTGDFTEEFSESTPIGTVISTTPAAGERVVRDSTVEVAVSKGPERYTVPKLAGMSQASATKALTDLTLVVGSVKQSWSESVTEGDVISASLPEGRSVKRGASVDLVVSKGRQPIEVTNYTGKSASTAEAKLEKAGFKVTVTTKHSDTVDKGDVISQSPKSGTAHRGDTIELVRSLGPVMVTVPNVYKMGISAAKSQMSKAGFKVSVKPVEQNYLGLGYVARSSPGFGKKAPKGSTITLYIV